MSETAAIETTVPQLRTPVATTVTYLAGTCTAVVVLRYVDRNGAIFLGNVLSIAVELVTLVLAEWLRRHHPTSLWRKARGESSDGGVVVGACLLAVAATQVITLPWWPSIARGAGWVPMWVLNAAVAATGVTAIIRSVRRTRRAAVAATAEAEQPRPTL